MTWLVRSWSLMFWLPPLVSATAAALAVGSGIVARPLPIVLWFVSALLLQFASRELSVAWSVGLAAQAALAVYLVIRLKLEA